MTWSNRARPRRSTAWLPLVPFAALLACVKIFPPLDAPVLDAELVQRGQKMFQDPSLSGDRSRACNTCHPGGASDGNVYRDGEPVRAGDAGARRPPQLRGAWQSAPYLWDGSAGSVDEALERMLRVEMRGAAVRPEDREALAAYVLSIPPFDSGRIQPDGSPVEPSTPGASRGWAVFRDNCTLCHRPPSFTIGLRFDVGTGGKLSSPSLRGLSQSRGPYGHDGRWASLEDAVKAMVENRELALGEHDIASLVEYLRLL